MKPGTILNLLKQAADEHQSKLGSKVKERLDARERGVLEWLFEQYQDPNKKRWYDPFHVLFSTNFALTLVEEENLDRLIVTGILLHDVGYFAIEDKTQWSAPHSRITHMQEGAALAAGVLCEREFTCREIGEIVGMISVHDNPYIGIPIQGKDRLALRDCDRVWVMHILSFYKDWTSKYEKYGHPSEFLLDRMTQFYGRELSFRGEKWKITEDLVKKNVERIEIPTYHLTREQVKKQLEQRIQELESGLLSDEDRFKEYLSKCLSIQVDEM